MKVAPECGNGNETAFIGAHETFSQIINGPRIHTLQFSDSAAFPDPLDRAPPPSNPLFKTLFIPLWTPLNHCLIGYANCKKSWATIEIAGLVDETLSCGCS